MRPAGHRLSARAERRGPRRAFPLRRLKKQQTKDRADWPMWTSAPADAAPGGRSGGVSSVYNLFKCDLLTTPADGGKLRLALDEMEC